QQDFREAFAQVDVIAAPTSPTTAFRLGERTADPLTMYLSDVLTVPVNLSAACALSIPCGFDSQGLPIGLQLIANTLQEALILDVAYAYEQTTRWYERAPHLPDSGGADNKTETE